MSNQVRADGDAQHANSTNETGGFVFGHGDEFIITEPIAREDLPAYAEPYADEPEIQAMHADGGKYGIMFSGDYNWDTGECVRRAFGGLNDLQGRSLQFHSEWMQPEEAAEYLEYMGPYNCFDPELVREGIKDLPADAWVALGREGSPAIYIHTRKARTVIEDMGALRSDVAQRRLDIRERLREIIDERDDLPDQHLVDFMLDQHEYGGEFGRLFGELDDLDSFAASGPDECGAFDSSEYPTKCVGEQDVADGQAMTVRLWWD
jgi:hypothetical protein